MSFRLRIDFTGLCLFLPEPDGSKLHVSLPDPSQMKTKSLTSHRASIFYNSAYETGAGSPSTSFREMLLQGATVLPGTIISGGIDPTVFDAAHVADIAEAAEPGNASGSKQVDRRAIDPADPCVRSVITVEGGGFLSSSISYPWHLHEGDPARPLAWKVGWLVQVEANELTLSTGKGGLNDTRTLKPVNGVVELRVKNVPLKESVPEDPPFDPAASSLNEHFEAFYSFFVGGPPPQVDVPKFGNGTRGARPLGMCFTCTPGRGTLA